MQMEETKLEAPKPTEALFAVPSHRRRHLRSETYHTLVRIMSYCYEYHELSEATQIATQELKSDSTSNLRQAVEEEIHEQIDSKDVESTQLEDLASLKVSAIDENIGGSSGQNKDLNDTRKMMDEMERMMMIEQNENVMVGESTEGNRFSYQEMLIDELEHIMQGNEVLLHEVSIVPLLDTLEQTRSVSDRGKPSNIAEKLVDCQQIIIEESGDVGERVSGTLFSLDRNVSGEISNQGEGNEDNRSSIKIKVLDNFPERQLNELALEKTSGTGGTTAPCPMIEAGEVEEGEQHGETVSESFVFSLDEEMTNEVIEQSENSKDKSFSMKTNVSEEEHEMQREDMEMEKSLYNNDVMISPIQTIVDGDVEEGEICSDNGMIERSNNTISEDTMKFEDNINEMQIFDQPTDINKFSPNTRKKKEVDPASSVLYTVENANHGREVEYGQSTPIEVACRPGIIVLEKNTRSEKGDANDLMLEEGRNRQKDSATKDGAASVAASHENQVLHGQVLKKNVTGNCEFSSEEKRDSGACKKKKRGPPSEERKAKRKRKERKRRAEKNRQLGVKRLKLHPVTKPKPVSYCHHYLKGRCYEGDKCKFSHDTVPLTKSTPCCYFARHSCMKGDDCPFDHQLSKYPCTSFASRGLCSKGDACMFSHKIPLKEESTPNTGRKPELKLASLSVESDSKKRIHNGSTSKQNADATSKPIGIYSCKKTKEIETETILKPTVQAPAGINFLSFGKSSSVYSNNVEPGISSPKRHGDVEVRNEGDQIGLGMLEMANQICKSTPPGTAANGISLLSLGKVSVEDSSKRMLFSHSSFSNRVKLSQLANPSLHMEATPTIIKDDNLKFSNGTHSVVKTVQNSNEMLKGTPTEPAPRGIDLFSSGKASIDICNSSSKPVCSSSNRKNDTGISSKDFRSVPIKHQKSISSVLQTNPVSSGQSSNNLACGIYKGMPNSALKALLSTFAFAAKYESLMGTNQSSGAPTIDSEVNKGNRNDSASVPPQNGSMKASEILNFLSGLGGKSNQ